MTITHRINICDGGRSTSRRPHRLENDCTVRALATVTDMAYDDAHDLLSVLGRTTNLGYGWDRLVKARMAARMPLGGYLVEVVKFSGPERLSPLVFAQRNLLGRWVLHVPGHVIACVDGILHDTVPPQKRHLVSVATRFVRDDRQSAVRKVLERAHRAQEVNRG